MTLVYTWQPPSLNVDGSAIPADGPGALVCTRVEFGRMSPTGIGLVMDERLVPVAIRSVEFQSEGPGRYFVRGYAVNGYGQESLEATPLFKDIP